MTSDVLKIGIAGLGNVGASVFRLLSLHEGMLRDRCGKTLKITAVSARDASKNRGIDLAGVAWHSNPVDLAADPNVDIVVELMGGASGAAFDTIKKAVSLGKPVVTANKALLATRGREVLDMGGAIAFEAAVAGGVPVIKALREGMAANDIRAIYGILNGTCNYILSEMAQTGRAFDDVLKEAQAKGYAEADPSFDIDGVDASHKLSILSGLSFSAVPEIAAVEVQGIRNVSALDISFARELGYCIKLLGIARRTDRGIEQSVEPCLVQQSHPVASVEGPLNAVYIDGDFVGKVLLMGAGAGGDATASAVVADIVDIARGRTMPLMGVQAARVGKISPSPVGHRIGSYFVRLMVRDEPGVIADVSAILRDCKVSLESVLQRGRDPGQVVPVILTTHDTDESAMRRAVELIGKLKTVTEPPHMMRIENFI